jgi:hypothetical protein
MVSMVLQDDPLAIPDVPSEADATFADLQERFDAGGIVVVSGAEINGALRHWSDDDLQIGFELRGSVIRFDMWSAVEERYFNVHAAFRGHMAKGQMVELFVDELTVGDIELGDFIEENVADSFNEKMEERGKDRPDLYERWGRIQRAEVREDALHLDVTPKPNGEVR